MTLKVRKLYKQAKLPQRASTDAVGFDLFVSEFIEYPEYVEIKTGIAIQPSEGLWCMLTPRSSCYKKGLLMTNSVGIIDPDYTGEIKAVMRKTSLYQGVKLGDRLLQLIVMPKFITAIIEVDKLDDTERGDGGFGSTNKQEKK